MIAQFGLPLGILLTALAGSLHCTSMCGPIVIATTSTQSERWRYHIGRLIGYLCLGLIFGFLGEQGSKSTLLPIQIGTSVLTGLLLIIIGFTRFSPKLNQHWVMTFWKKKAIALFSKLQQTKTIPEPFKHIGIGYISAGLPCGLLYGVISASVLSENVYQALLLISLFWLGTLPALTLLPHWIKTHLKNYSPLTNTILSLAFIGIGIGVIALRLHAIFSNSTCCH